jgi:nucleotide-binding universal stress UspA family protein
MFKKLLVPVDGSDPSNAAINIAIRLAGEQDGEIMFVHAIDTISDIGLAAHGNLGLARQVLEDTGKEVLAAAAAATQRAKVKAAAKLLDGEIVGQILGAGKDFRADLIVVGSHGRSGIARALLGSVSEGITRRADIPVLIVHATKESENPDEQRAGRTITVL